MLSFELVAPELIEVPPRPRFSRSFLITARYKNYLCSSMLTFLRCLRPPEVHLAPLHLDASAPVGLTPAM